MLLLMFGLLQALPATGQSQADKTGSGRAVAGQEAAFLGLGLDEAVAAATVAAAAAAGGAAAMGNSGSADVPTSNIAPGRTTGTTGGQAVAAAGAAGLSGAFAAVGASQQSANAGFTNAGGSLFSFSLFFTVSPPGSFVGVLVSTMGDSSAGTTTNMTTTTR